MSLIVSTGGEDLWLAYFDCYRYFTFPFFTFEGPPLSNHLKLTFEEGIFWLKVRGTWTTLSSQFNIVAPLHHHWVKAVQVFQAVYQSLGLIYVSLKSQHSARLYPYMCTFCAFMRAVIYRSNDANNNNRCIHLTFPPEGVNFFGLYSRRSWKTGPVYLWNVPSIMSEYGSSEK